MDDRNCERGFRGEQRVFSCGGGLCDRLERRTIRSPEGVGRPELAVPDRIGNMDVTT
jgi:hypothetical protein